MGSAKDTAIRGYLKLPKGVRNYTDPIIRNRGKVQNHYQTRRNKGEKIIVDLSRKVLKLKRRK